MRIIHLQDIFHPEAGYQENVIAKYHSLQHNEVYVISSDYSKVPDNISSFFGKEAIVEKDKKLFAETGVRVIRIPTYFYISGRAIYSEWIFKLIDSLDPDILFIHGNDTYAGIRYILKASKAKFPIIFDNHMLESAAHNPLRRIYYFLYKKICAKRIIDNSLAVIRTENDDFVQKRLGIPEDLSPIIQFGSDLLLFNKNMDIRRAMRKEIGINDDAFVVIYAGKLDKYKGGQLLAEAMRSDFSCNKVVEFVIVGNFVGEYGNEVEKTMKVSQNKVHFFPTQRYGALPKFWQMSDCAVFPKECSTTFFDAQACGLPCISEDGIKINVDRLSHGNGF